MKIRYLYIKNGDVVSQMKHIASIWPQTITSGPDAFVYDFISHNPESEILLISRGQRKATLRYGNTIAIVFREKLGVFGKLPAKLMYFFIVLYQALKFRPGRILCGSTGGPLWVSFIVSRLLAIPFVHSRHNRVTFEGDSWYRRIGQRVDGFIIRRADGVVCHGPYLKNELAKLGIAENKLFEFDVGFSDMINLDTSKCIGDTARIDEQYLLYMGRIERNKGVFDLLDAAAELYAQDEYSFKLVFAGDGRHLEELRETVRGRDLEKQVIILGRIPHDELSHIICNSLAVVTPTHSNFPEGRCMAAMEALVMGVPVIAPSFGPFPYLVQHGVNGLLFSPKSIGDLMACIKRLLNSDVERKMLKEGAVISGRKLLKPPRTFSQAVGQAFNTTGASNIYISE